MSTQKRRKRRAANPSPSSRKRFKPKTEKRAEEGTKKLNPKEMRLRAAALEEEAKKIIETDRAKAHELMDEADDLRAAAQHIVDAKGPKRRGKRGSA